MAILTPLWRLMDWEMAILTPLWDADSTLAWSATASKKEIVRAEFALHPTCGAPLALEALRHPSDSQSDTDLTAYLTPSAKPTFI